MHVGETFRVRSSGFGAVNPHSAFRNPKSNGFTLIELVITIVLVGLLSGLASLIILQGVRAYSGEQFRSDVHYQARFAMERMAREIRLIRSQGADLSTMANNDLRFIDMDGATAGFNRAGLTLNRWNGVSNDLLATGITAFTFSYYQQDGVTAAAPANLWFVDITMTAAAPGGETIDMRTRVHPRNF